jgi:hypothetical protein
MKHLVLAKNRLDDSTLEAAHALPGLRTLDISACNFQQNVTSWEMRQMHTRAHAFLTERALRRFRQTRPLVEVKTKQCLHAIHQRRASR